MSVPCLVLATQSQEDPRPADALVVVTPYPFAEPGKELSPSLASLTHALTVPHQHPFNELPALLQLLKPAIDKAKEIDAVVGEGVSLLAVDEAPGRRVVLSPTGPLGRDYDDVRRFADAAKAGLDRAVAAGAKRPCVVVNLPSNLSADYTRAVEVAVLGTMAAAHVPLEAREATLKQSRVDALLFPQLSTPKTTFLAAIEAGRSVARDIGGADPERMAAQRICEYLEQEFKDTCISITVEKDLQVLNDKYPLLSAVGRCSLAVPRHHPRVVHMEYVGEGEITQTLFLVGKGITYDTGGADIKCSGHMAGMHRDKVGAAVVCGFFAVLARIAPPGLRVVGKLALVRNSAGADAYVSDEIIVSRGGVRVRVGNTDAEGRMVMSDLLCLAKEEALTAVSPKLFTIATLTGHAVKAYGENYSITMDNGPAKQQNVSTTLSNAGHLWGDPFEISTIRREDYEFNAAKFPTEDVVQCNSAPSTATARGHQLPAAFMIVASGLDKHGIDSEQPLAYSHLDIAGSTKDWPEPVSAAPLPALTAAFVLPHLIGH